MKKTVAPKATKPKNPAKKWEWTHEETFNSLHGFWRAKQLRSVEAYLTKKEAFAAAVALWEKFQPLCDAE